MGRVDLHHSKTGSRGPGRRGGEGGDDVRHGLLVQLVGDGGLGVEGDRTGPDHGPTALIGEEGFSSLPRPRRTRLSAGVGQLDGGHSPVIPYKAGNASERWNERVVPKP